VKTGLTAADWNAGEWIRQNIKKNRPVLANAGPLVPATVVEGRQTFCGEERAMWVKGARIAALLAIVREVERTGRAVDVMERVAVQSLVVRKGARLEEVALAEEGLELAFTNDAWTVLRRNNTVERILSNRSAIGRRRFCIVPIRDVSGVKWPTGNDSGQKWISSVRYRNVLSGGEDVCRICFCIVPIRDVSGVKWPTGNGE
jgi:hypothetical protein